MIESICFVVGVAQELTSVTYVELYHPFAEGGSNYKVWEELDYTNYLGSTYNNRLNWVSAEDYFDWRFTTTTDDIFAIKVSAKVEWAHWTGSFWESAGESGIWLVITIANYWQ